MLSLRLAQILHDEADGLGREILGVAALIDGGKGFHKGRTAANPGVQTVQGHVGRGIGEVVQGELALGVAADGEFFLVHNDVVFRCVTIWFTGAKYMVYWC